MPITLIFYRAFIALGEFSDSGLELLNKYLSVNKELIIFDRLYLTHIWRTGMSVESFKESTSLLLSHNAQICFLEIPAEKIAQRINLAQSHRDADWNAYVNSKGNNQNEIIEYYTNQQNELLELLKVIPVPYTIFDTSGMDWQRIAEEIDLLV